MTFPKLPKITLFTLTIILQVIIRSNLVYAVSCDYGTVVGNKHYSYSLASPSKNFPHGVLSEDGFYKVAANDTIIWFQLCDVMIFNHDPPRCVDCWDCGGPSRCGTGCSALVAKDTGGYYVCSTIGHHLDFDINLTDQKTPNMGVTVTMSSKANGVNCSLSVSVVCDSNGVKEPGSFEKSGTCNYTTVLRHPSGCPKIAVHGTGWGWFSVFLTILLCGLGAYLLVGAVYRFFSLGIRGVDLISNALWVITRGPATYRLTGQWPKYDMVIPNLVFWTSVPHRTKSLFMSLVQRFRGPTHHHTSSYSSVNF